MTTPVPIPWYRRLHVQILIGMAAGVVVGLVVEPDHVPWFEWIGDLFLRLLKMVVVPLVAASVTLSVASLGDPKKIGRMGGRTLVYYLFTSCAAILTGLVMVNLFQPGAGVDLGGAAGAAIEAQSFSVLDFLKRMIPENPLGAAALFGSKVEGGGGAGLLGLIFFCILFGLFTARIGGRTRETILGVLDAVFGVMMAMTSAIIRTAPLGVAALLAAVVARSGADVILPLLGYMGVVLAALAVHFFVTLPLLLSLVGKRNPVAYFRAVGSALATGFSTASSNAALPLTMKYVEDPGGVDRRTATFVLPLGATVNMDGTALYECVAALFVAQAYGIDLGLGQQLIVCLTALLASVGAAGIPHAGLVMMTIVFQAVGLPLEAIGVILGVDRILDMCRTTTNIWSDAVGAAVVDRFEGSRSL
jgi:proton glutamate symport protein